MLERMLEVAATVWVYSVVALIACLGLGLVVRLLVPERPYDSPGLLHRIGTAIITPLIAIAVAPVAALIGLALGAQALSRRAERRQQADPSSHADADADADADAGEADGDGGPTTPQH